MAITYEELQDAIRLIQENIDESQETWEQYVQKWEHDFQRLNDSGKAMEALQAFRHSKAAHYRQIAIARAELAGLKAIL